MTNITDMKEELSDYLKAFVITTESDETSNDKLTQDSSLDEIIHVL